MRLNHTSRYRAIAVAAGAVICIVCATASTMAQQCIGIDPLNPPKTAYRVRKIRIENKLDVLHAMSNYLEDLKAELPLKETQVYPLPDIINSINEGRDAIDTRLDQTQKTEHPRTPIRF